MPAEEASWIYDGLDFPAGSQWSIRATYQWFSGTVAIKGATAPVFTPTAAQAGKPLHVKTTFSSKGFDVSRVTCIEPMLRPSHISGATMIA